MALTTDQQAVLQLLLERGQSYPDLARVLGTDEAGVRERARAALAELSGSDPDAHLPLTDFLLGQADPIDRADAIRRLREDPGDRALATELSARLRELYPEAQLPRLPGEQRPSRLSRRPRAPGAEPQPARAARLGGLRGLSERQTRLVAVLGSAAVIVIAVVLALTGAFGGGEDEEEPVAATTPTAPTDTSGEELAVIDMEPTSGGNATGRVAIGVASAGQPYADLALEGLEPAGNEDAYVLWLLLNERTGYPVSTVTVPANGRLTERYAIPSAVAAVAARTRFVDISLADRRRLQREVLGAAREGRPVIPYSGESVLRGAVGGSGAQRGG